MEMLPPEIDLDEFRTAWALASPDTVVRRLGVQSVIIRTSYYHIRFTLHEPYASSSPSLPLSGDDKDKHDKAKKDPIAECQANSLDIAVGSADKLITLIDYARPDFLANASLAVPGHVSWSSAPPCSSPSSSSPTRISQVQASSARTSRRRSAGWS